MNSNKQRIYNESFPIRSYDVRPDGSAKLLTLCNFLQEAAGNHAHELNYDIETLRSLNRTWVLYRLQLEIQRYPRWGDTVYIETWPSGGDGLLAYRDFLLSDQDTDLLARVTSQWMIVDLEKERPVRIPEEVLDMEIDKRQHTLEPNRKKIKYSSVDTEERIVNFKIRRNDLDLNGHVNNVSFISWITESIPQKTYRNRRLSSLDIVFHRECHIGDEIRSKSKSESSGSSKYVHQIVRNGDPKPLSTARTCWDHSSEYSRFYN